jgi:hypothetical protein
MQLVGKTCSVCTKRIDFAPDATACAACAALFHNACATETCPVCARNIQLEAQRLTLEHAQMNTAAEQWGRLVVTLICVGIVLLNVALFALTWSKGDMGSSGVQLIVMLSLASALYFGQGWARVYFGLSCALGAMVYAKFSWNAFAEGTPLSALGWLAFTLLFATAAAVLLYSKRVKVFLASQRGH